MDFIGDKITANSWQWIVITLVWYNYKNIKGPFWRFCHILAVWLQIKHRTLLLSIFQIIPRPVCVMKECRLKRDRISQLHWCDNTSLWVHVCVVINAKSKTREFVFVLWFLCCNSVIAAIGIKGLRLQWDKIIVPKERKKITKSHF